MYSKSAHRIIRERLLHWYLFTPRSFSLPIEQLAQMITDLEKPTRLGWGPGSKKEKIDKLYNYLQVYKSKAIGQSSPPDLEGL
jgi:hypothetical protein